MWHSIQRKSFHKPWRVANLPITKLPAHPKVQSRRIGTDALGSILDKAQKARTKSIQLDGIDFAQDLSKQMLKFALDMEKLYGDLKTAVTQEPVDENNISTHIASFEKHKNWFEKAEAGKWFVCKNLLTHQVVCGGELPSFTLSSSFCLLPFHPCKASANGILRGSGAKRTGKAKAKKNKKWTL